MATTIQIEPLRNSLKSIASLSGPAMESLARQWAFRYRTFIQARFDRFSKGGGNWPPLKRSTLLARARRAVGRAREQNALETGESDATRAKRLKAAQGRYNKAKKSIDAGTSKETILRDTGVLFAALAPHFIDGPASVFERIPHGVRVGIGGHATHAGGKTIGQIAFWHDEGAGNLPKREIIVDPDEATVAGMRADAERAIDKALRDAGN